MPEEHEITQLRRVGQGENVEVHVDGEPVWKLHRPLVDKLNLFVGRRLSPDELTQMRQEIALHQAKASALRMLGQRARTEADLRRRLLGKRYPVAAVEATVAWLQHLGYLNDEQYAQDRTASLQRRKMGRRAIEFTLLGEGVDDELARDVVAAQAGELQETELACELARELAAKWRGLDRLRRRNRIYQHLLRRGFEMEAIIAALAQIDPDDGLSDMS